MRRLLLPGVCVLALGVLGAFAAGAGAAPKATTCNATTVMPPTINGDVEAGPGCDLSNVTLVRGDVEVIPGGSLTISFGSPITIRGDVEGKKATFIDIESGTIRGDVRIEATTGGQTFIGFGRVDGKI